MIPPLLLRLLYQVLPISLIVGIIGYTLVGEEGLLNRYDIKQDLYATQARVELISEENKSLRLRIEAIRQDPDAVRRVAAERMLLAPAGSVIYRFE
ncbi:MAG: septum formation initiator family protein [Myxococcota bacterium]|nr:septum formation initiator family protein [Myxococcota bacterium]